MATLPRYIPLAEAARRIGLDAGILTHLIESGKMYIKAIQEGETLLVSERWADNMARRSKTLREKFWPQVAKYEDDYVFNVTDAREVYKLNAKTVDRYIKSGIIRCKEPGGVGRGYERMLNKADLEYIKLLVQHSREHGGGRGHRLIGPDTLPPHMAVKREN